MSKREILSYEWAIACMKAGCCPPEGLPTREEYAETQREAEEQHVLIEFTKRVMHAMVERGWTQLELAERAGITQPMLSRFLARRDKRSPRLATLVKIALALEMSLDLVLSPASTKETE